MTTTAPDTTTSTLDADLHRALDYSIAALSRGCDPALSNGVNRSSSFVSSSSRDLSSSFISSSPHHHPCPSSTTGASTTFTPFYTSVIGNIHEDKNSITTTKTTTTTTPSISLTENSHRDKEAVSVSMSRVKLSPSGNVRSDAWLKERPLNGRFCFHWNATGKCQRGTKCMYLHEPHPRRYHSLALSLFIITMSLCH